MDGMTLYKRDIEPILLEQTTIFYQEEGRTLVQSCDVPQFLKKVSYITRALL
jgi:cullin 3